MKDKKLVSLSEFAALVPDKNPEVKGMSYKEKKNHFNLKRSVKKKKNKKNKRPKLVRTFDQFITNNGKPIVIPPKRDPQKSMSGGEKKIFNYLRTRNIPFKYDSEYKGLINPHTGQKLRFDFFLHKHNIVIEFDGKQHFEFNPSFHSVYGSNSLEEQMFRDNHKNTFCRNKKIKMVRIKYSEFMRIERILDQYVNLVENFIW